MTEGSIGRRTVESGKQRPWWQHVGSWPHYIQEHIKAET